MNAQHWYHNSIYLWFLRSREKKLLKETANNPCSRTTSSPHLPTTVLTLLIPTHQPLSPRLHIPSHQSGQKNSKDDVGVELRPDMRGGNATRPSCPVIPSPHEICSVSTFLNYDSKTLLYRLHSSILAQWKSPKGDVIWSSSKPSTLLYLFVEFLLPIYVSAIPHPWNEFPKDPLTGFLPFSEWINEISPS